MKGLLTILMVFSSACCSCGEVESHLFSPKVKVRCHVLVDRCQFVNEGDPGEACVRVKVTLLGTGRVVLSDPVCSGQLDRDEPKVVPIVWSAGDPRVYCMGPDLKGDFAANCSVDVLEGG